LEALKDSNGNLIESNKINKNSVALKDKEKEGTKGVNLVLKLSRKDKKCATFFDVKNTISVTLTEFFLAYSCFDNGDSAIVIMGE
jgi:hypothetical protein